MRKLLFLALGGLLLALAPACGGDDGSETPGPDSGETSEPADVVAVFAGPETARAVLAAAKGVEGIQLYLLPSSTAGDGAFDPATLPGAEIRGVRPAFPEVPDFRDRYSAAYEYPDAMFPGFRESYDSVYLIAMAVLAAGTADPAVVRENIDFVANAPGDAVVAGPAGFAAAIETLSTGGDVNFAGVSGLNDLDTTGAASKAATETWTVLNGALAPLELRDVDLAAELGAENPPGALKRAGDPSLSGPLKIGVIVSLSGSGEAQGVAARDAMQLAADEINEAGGIYGQDVELVVQNDGGGADGALGAADALRNEGVTAIIGPLGDDAAVAAANAIPQDSPVPVLALSPSPALATVNNLSFFRVTPSATIETVVLANLARERDLSAACILYEDTDGAKQMVEAFRGAFSHKDGRSRKPVALTEGADYAALLAGCRQS